MGYQTQYDREEEQLYKDYEAGLISRGQLNAGLRELAQDYREAAMESAEHAYLDELDRW